MRYQSSLSPSVEAGARVAFEGLAATVEVEARPDRQALFSRYAGYYALLSRLPRRMRRRLQRRWRRSLTAIALLLALGQAPALAATLTVAPGVAPDIALDGACSLIEAIENANADLQTHADCLLGSGADTIVLPESSTQILTRIHNSAYNYTGLPVISSAITIEGNGSTLIRDRNAPAFRIFAVNHTGDLALNATTVSGGTLNLFTFVSNGGGILVVPGGRLSITNSTVAGNRADYGGGVFNDGTATLTNSTVSGNTTSFGGGGGGVQNVGTATLTNSTVSGNSAAGVGGGVVNYDAVYSYGTLTLARSLVSGNTAATGAEIRRGSGTVTADSFNLFGHSGLTYAQAFSGFTPGATDLTATSDGTKPKSLGAILDTTLANNDGPTQTHALIVGSPAIDAVATACPPPVADQRGVSRPQGLDCDIGAFELAPPPAGSADLGLSLTDTPDLLTVNGQLTYTITVRNNGPGTATGVQVVDSLPPGAVLAGPASSSQGECRGTVTVVCDLGTLAAGAQATETINVIPTVTGDLSNAATVAAFEIDPNPENNSTTETTTVQPSDPARADLAITAVADVGPRASDQGFTYTLRVRNNGPATATGVQLTNDLPRGIALEQITPSQGSCGGTDPVLCALGALTSGAEATVTIGVIRTEVETLPNRAAVNGDQFDPNSGDNFALTSALDVPTARTTCNSKRCKLRLTCNLSDLLGRRCDNQDITLFVDTRARRDTGARLLSDERVARAVLFAAAIRNFPGGVTTNVPLKLTSKGRKVASTLVQQGRKKLRGEMRISNAAGGIGTDIIRLTVRLK